MHGTAGDGWPGMPPIDALETTSIGTRATLWRTLARIDGWGRNAWREIMGVWQLRTGSVVLETQEAGGDEDERTQCILVLDRHGLAMAPEDADATADWLLRAAWRMLLKQARVDALTIPPAAAVRATTACQVTRERLQLRLLVRLPFAGMCIDALRLRRFLGQAERFLATLAHRRRRPELVAHQRAVRMQRALRAALPAHGLVAFLGVGARLARARDGGPDPACRPLALARGQGLTIDLGPWGRVRGLGIRRGVTVVTGAPYHGKSTLLAALVAGREDHPPGDGRELVVADAGAVLVQAEDGRRIKAQDTRLFFRRLPGAESASFTTERASGATSMAASLLQAIAAGSRLLLIDEDTAAANFLAIGRPMRRLLGASLAGHTTLVELLPRFAQQGVSVVLVAGSSAEAFAGADQVLQLDHFRPHDVTRRARRLVGAGRAVAAGRGVRVPARILADAPDCLLGPRHFLPVGAGEPERPVLPEGALDLRRCGWELDAALVRGACAGAAWACRLAEPGMDLAALGGRFSAFLAARSLSAIDPFHTQLLARPPWQLVVTVLERLARPRLRCR